MPISQRYSVLWPLIYLKLGLRVSFLDEPNDYSSERRFRLAVVDLDKAAYPLNFVCMLPKQFTSGWEKSSKFAKIFGNESLALAKKLLLEAFETETSAEVKVEIERRLKLLEPKATIQTKCSGCGRLFQSKRIRRFHQNLCEECLKQRFGYRT
jgi:hypothetical protein